MKKLNLLYFVSAFLIFGSLAISAENILSSTTFSKDDKWTIYIPKSARESGCKAVFTDGKLEIYSAKMEKQNASNIQLIKNVALGCDKKYKLKLKVNSNKEGKLRIGYGLRKSPYTAYARTTIEITNGDKEYSCIIAPKKDKKGNYNAPRCLRIVAGLFVDAKLTLSFISLEEIK